MKISKARITNYGPPRAETDWRGREVKNRAVAAEHDKMVKGLPLAVLRAMARDLWKRPRTNRRDPEQWWAAERLAAVGRETARITA